MMDSRDSVRVGPDAVSSEGALPVALRLALQTLHSPGRPTQGRVVSELSDGLVDGHVVWQDVVVEDEFDGVRLNRLLLL